MQLIGTHQFQPFPSQEFELNCFFQSIRSNRSLISHSKFEFCLKLKILNIEVKILVNQFQIQNRTEETNSKSNFKIRNHNRNEATTSKSQDVTEKRFDLQQTSFATNRTSVSTKKIMQLLVVIM
ncbi:unnamed protein product [Rotaria magnacalcarata]|uniref:Uncharacterized protein n=1 Tax=Rotaria magnacalcarata TaxID=392030 RepID=A0A8S2N4B8_9BILA|nr:unnamed protein product [Rotaria magnacalcarata]